MSNTHSDPSTILAAAQAWNKLLSQSEADDTILEALERQILDARLSDNPALRELELRAQGDVLLGRIQGVHDCFERGSAEWEHLRPVVAWLHTFVGEGVPPHLAT